MSREDDSSTKAPQPGVNEPSGRYPSTRTVGQPPDRCDDVLETFISAHRLSQQMGRILRLSTRGESNKEIANALGIDVRTLSTHWTRIYARTGTRSAQEFRALLFRYAVMHADLSRSSTSPAAAVSGPPPSDPSDDDRTREEEYVREEAKAE